MFKQKIIPIFTALALLSTTPSMAQNYYNQAKVDKQIELSKKWSSGQMYKTSPSIGEDGSIRFVYGAEVPMISCAILQVCDIALEPGEVVNNINIGDSVRWNISPAITGNGENRRIHLIVKPLDSGLNTTMVVSTNRRAYHIQLKSTNKDYMPFVSFVYPEDIQTQLARVKEYQDEIQQREILATGQNVNNLNFEYKIKGNTNWKPLRVYDDGRQTFVQMPKTMSQSDAPVLLVLKDSGGLFTNDKTAIINYRVIDDRYIVDGVFEELILIDGVGGSQKKVTISRGI